MSKLFLYQAYKHDGECVSGEIESVDYQRVLVKIDRLGMSPMFVQEKVNHPSGAGPLPVALLGTPLAAKRIDDLYLERWTRRMANLLAAAFRLDEAMILTRSQNVNERFDKIIDDLILGVRNGQSLSDQMNIKNRFPEWYTALVKTGELSGQMANVMAQAAGHLEKGNIWKAKVRMSLVYPAIVFITGLAAAAIITIVVIPDLCGLFEEAGLKLPLLMKLLRNPWPAALMLTVSIFFICMAALNNTLREKFMEKISLMPFLGDLKRRIEMEKFCRTMALLTENAIELPAALDVAATSSSSIYRDAIKSTKAEVSAGRPVAEAMAAKGRFPGWICHIIHVNETAGKISQGFSVAAADLRMEIESKMTLVLSLLGPILLIVVMAFIGPLIAAVAGCVFNMDRLIQY